MRRALLSAAFFTVWVLPSAGQTPRPFPGAAAPPPSPARPEAPRAARPEPAPSVQAVPSQPAPAAESDPNAPSATTVGFPVFPGAQYLAVYEAGKGQRYYIYGSTAPYAELVDWYQTQLRDRGDEVFVEPATHMFAQRFREETMAFPPGVTVKDWTSGGSQGYPNPRPGAQPPRFPVVIMIVPPPPAAAGR